MIAALAAALVQVALGAAPSASAPLATPATGAPAAPPAAGEKIICKTLRQTGSLFDGPKECHSKREWDAINAASRDNVSDYQQRSHRTGGG